MLEQMIEEIKVPHPPLKKEPWKVVFEGKILSPYLDMLNFKEPVNYPKRF